MGQDFTSWCGLVDLNSVWASAPMRWPHAISSTDVSLEHHPAGGRGIPKYKDMYCVRMRETNKNEPTDPLVCRSGLAGGPSVAGWCDLVSFRGEVSSELSSLGAQCTSLLDSQGPFRLDKVEPSLTVL